MGPKSMSDVLPLLVADGYKICHHKLYMDGTEFVYSNATARSSRIKDQDKIVVFGIQYFIKEYLIDQWNKNFFEKDVEEVVAEYKRVISNYLGPSIIDEQKIRYLHSLGYLPIRIKALPEGALCPLQVPILTMINTDPKCYWLTNFLETVSQTATWILITSATTAFRFKKMLNFWADHTCDSRDFVQWQGHDFSMRGMGHPEMAKASGAAHLISFKGTDTIPSILFLEKYYGANIEKELIGASVTASEHSVQCSYFNEDSGDEDEYIEAMLNAQPDGIVSIVSDGYDYWKMITENFPKFKERIMGRNGKVVIRPDTGNPVRIVAGYRVTQKSYTKDELISRSQHHTFSMEVWENCECIQTVDNYYVLPDLSVIEEHEAKGSIQVLYEKFGGAKNSKGYIDLDPHIGLIYGDSITYEIANEICARLAQKGFSSQNVVFGIGSYTYQYTTRDVYGLAFKATWIQVNGAPKAIFKNPKTGKSKKSAKGLLRVDLNENNEYVLKDNCSALEEQGGQLVTVFENGQLLVDHKLSEIRNRLENY